MIRRRWEATREGMAVAAAVALAWVAVERVGEWVTESRVAATVILGGPSAAGHAGPPDERGCHYDERGRYHCH